MDTILILSFYRQQVTGKGDHLAALVQVDGVQRRFLFHGDHPFCAVEACGGGHGAGRKKTEAQQAAFCLLCLCTGYLRDSPPFAAGCPIGVPIDFPEFRPGPVLLPESFCIPFGAACGGLSRGPSHGLHKAGLRAAAKENKAELAFSCAGCLPDFVFFILHRFWQNASLAAKCKRMKSDPALRPAEKVRASGAWANNIKQIQRDAEIK